MCEVTQFIKDHRFEINNGLVSISPTLDKIVRDGMKAIDNAVVEVIERHEKAIEGEFIPTGVALGKEKEERFIQFDMHQRQMAAAQSQAANFQGAYGLQDLQGAQGLGLGLGSLGQAAFNNFRGF